MDINRRKAQLRKTKCHFSVSSRKFTDLLIVDDLVFTVICRNGTKSYERMSFENHQP